MSKVGVVMSEATKGPRMLTRNAAKFTECDLFPQFTQTKHISPH